MTLSSLPERHCVSIPVLFVVSHLSSIWCKESSLTARLGIVSTRVSVAHPLGGPLKVQVRPPAPMDLPEIKDLNDHSLYDSSIVQRAPPVEMMRGSPKPPMEIASRSGAMDGGLGGFGSGALLSLGVAGTLVGSLPDAALALFVRDG